MSFIKPIATAALFFVVGIFLAFEPTIIMFAIGFVLVFGFGFVLRNHRPQSGSLDSDILVFCAGVALGQFLPFDLSFTLFQLPETVWEFAIGGALGLGGAIGYLRTFDKFEDYVAVDPIIFEKVLEPHEIFSNFDEYETSVSAQLVKSTEKRLGVKIPRPFKTLYKIQNGGYLRDKMLFKDDENLYCFWQEPMLPMQKWVTAFEHFQIYNDPNDPDYAEWFIPQTRKLVIFLVDHQDIIFIDFNQEGEPKVGYAFDHGQPGWYEKAIRWETAQEFLNSLRRFESAD